MTAPKMIQVEAGLRMDSHTLNQAESVAEVAARSAGDFLKNGGSDEWATVVSTLQGQKKPLSTKEPMDWDTIVDKAKESALRLLENNDLGFEIFTPSSDEDVVELPPAPVWVLHIPRSVQGRKPEVYEIFVSVSLVMKGVPVIGVLYDIYTDKVYSGKVGDGGASCNRVEIHPANTTLSGSTVLMNLRLPAPHMDREGYSTHVANTMRNIILAGASNIEFVAIPAKAFAMVASGQASCYFEFGVDLSSACAGLALARAAGASCVTLPHEDNMADVVRSRRYIVACTSAVATSLLSCIAGPIPFYSLGDDDNVDGSDPTAEVLGGGGPTSAWSQGSGYSQSDMFLSGGTARREKDPKLQTKAVLYVNKGYKDMYQTIRISEGIEDIVESPAKLPPLPKPVSRRQREAEMYSQERLEKSEDSVVDDVTPMQSGDENKRENKIPTTLVGLFNNENVANKDETQEHGVDDDNEGERWGAEANQWGEVGAKPPIDPTLEPADFQVNFPTLNNPVENSDSKTPKSGLVVENLDPKSENSDSKSDILPAMNISQAAENNGEGSAIDDYIDMAFHIKDDESIATEDEMDAAETVDDYLKIADSEEDSDDDSYNNNGGVETINQEAERMRRKKNKHGLIKNKKGKGNKGSDDYLNIRGEDDKDEYLQVGNNDEDGYLQLGGIASI
eukprot:m.112914 g.112914  ORF g.112914 m.112914 type:complete len:676 (+) comp14112_c0_seq1:273-2300(+)